MTDWIYGPHEKLLKEELASIEASIDKYKTIVRTSSSATRPIASATWPVLLEKIQSLKTLRAIVVRQLSLLEEYKEADNE